MIIGSGYAAAAALGLTIVSGLGGYFHGLDTGKMRVEAAARKDVDAANAERDRLRAQIERAALLHLQADQARQSTHREIVRESTKFIDRPVYRNVCIDADGVRALDRAADNANARDSRPSAGEAGPAAQGAAERG